MPAEAIRKSLKPARPQAKLRLVDDSSLRLEASIAGKAERYGRGKTSHTIHVWWARRPHGAMRALTFASLVPASSPNAEKVMSALAFADSPHAAVIGQAKALLAAEYPEGAKVLDMFGGGGTIPFEAALLGADVEAMDYNRLSVFVQKCNLEFSQDALAQSSLANLASLVRESGTRVLRNLADRTADLFPLRRGGDGPFAYFWSYSYRCAGCDGNFFLMRRKWLSRKRGRQYAFSISTGDKKQSVSIIGFESDKGELATNTRKRTAAVRCPHCSVEHKNLSIKSCKDELLALGELGRAGKVFSLAGEDAVPHELELKERERIILDELGMALPNTRLPRWSGIVNPALYGIETHSDFLNPRQRLIVLELIRALLREHENLTIRHPAAIARYVTGTLSALIDQLVDWNCRLSMWISQNEQVGRAFCGPGVPMLWDYVETDPVSKGPANLWDKLERIIAGVSGTPKFSGRVTVNRGQAQHLPFKDRCFDAVITDPPYYDNIYYNVLADFFYVWKRPVLKHLSPELFNSPQCDEEAELVASQFRHGNHVTAHAWYCSQMTSCLQEAARVLKPDGILSFVFAHSSLAGWEAIVSSFRNSGLTLTAAEPLSVERKQRPRAVTSEAINTCIILVARKKTRVAPIMELGELANIVASAGVKIRCDLERYGWSDEDIGMAIFAQGVRALANSSFKETDAIALQRIEETVRMITPAFKLQTRESL